MLDVALKKVEKTRLQTQPEFYKGFAEELPFRDGEFHFISCAFGVRNFHNLDAGLREMHRVLTSGGKAEILEFSKPCGGLFATLFKFYFKRILPVLGRLISKDPAAYTYLPESVGAFPSGMAFVKHLEAAGFRDITARPLTFGTVTLYSGIK
jgi:demethylmenaquinone methyltransferase / 2-methoxy-6-polyprenyl-1,4-benzoquinol methylase